SFVTHLRDHVLAREVFARGEDPDAAEFSSTDRANIVILNNKIYWHHVLRVNFTTYDRHCTQDSINPRTHADILLLAPPGSPHKYLYARIIKIFHVYIHIAESDAHTKPFERYNMLFVQWFRLDSTFAGGFATKRLYRLEFVPADDARSDAFSFVDPEDII
ncbi:hypothetical protein C8Q70DRAFT_925426, partial [Cubamyces menziesii]